MRHIALAAKNAHGVPTEDRNPTAKQQLLAAQKMSHFYEDGIERIVYRRLGPKIGKVFMHALERSRADVQFGAMFLLGMVLNDWQAEVIASPSTVVVARGSNGIGKTVGLCAWYFLSGAPRRGAIDQWGLYRMSHMAPEETMALETKLKGDEILRNRAREQWDDSKGAYRPALLRYFVRDATFGPHKGYEFFVHREKGKPESDFVSATLIFRPTAGRVRAGDGSDPMRLGLDEGRHEQNFTDLYRRIWVPRLLRTPGAQFFIPYTGFEASPELEAVKYEAENDTSGTYLSLDLDLDRDNPHITEQQKEITRRLLPDDQTREQVFTGKASQPTGARFVAAAVAAAFPPPPELLEFSWLGDGVCECPSCAGRTLGIAPLRDRIRARCVRCKARRDPKHPEHKASLRHEPHLLPGGLDPASSAKGADDTVFTIWDLDPPSGKPAECVYIWAAPPGTRIQHVAQHAAAIARHTESPFGFDRKSGLGHALEDQLIEYEGDFVPIQFDTREEKDRGLDFFKGLVDHEWWHSMAFHLRTRTQAINYVRADRNIATDFLMAQVVCALTAQPYLPIHVAMLGDARDFVPPDGEEEDRYMGADHYGDYGAAVMDDVYAGAGALGRPY